MSKHSCLALCFKNLDAGLPQTEILLVLQPTVDGDEKEEWHWSLPGGKCCHDKLKEGDCCPETAEETIIRECREETGYLMAIKRLISVKYRLTKTEVKFKRYFFLVGVVGGQPLEKQVFHQKTPRWFLLNRMPTSVFPSHRKIMKRVVQEMVKGRFSI